MGKLYQALEELAASDRYPFHMPGHKRNLPEKDGVIRSVSSIDITEIEGFDNLHAPQGVIEQEQQRAARLFGAEESYFLVGGSSVGVISAICSQTRYGDKLLLARNSHKSAYHAAYLNGLNIDYIYPKRLGELQIAGEISRRDVEEAMDKSGAKVVCIVSPTYEGIVSDIQQIARAVHQRDGILIVDEAHGAHLHLMHDFCRSRAGQSFKGMFPESATKLGADIVIESLHKTLPALTQTAVLHRCSDRAQQRALKRYLAMLQSSSPSYVLMASISYCLDCIETARAQFDRDVKPVIGDMEPELLEAYCSRLTDFYSAADRLSVIRVMNPSEMKKYAFGFDPSKLILSLPSYIEEKYDGYALSRELLEEYRIDTEMGAGSYSLAMSSFCDTREGFERLTAALQKTDEKLRGEKQFASTGLKREKITKEENSLTGLPVMSLRDALDARSETVPESKAMGRICAEFISCYPPGIPLAVPGERLTKEILSAIRRSSACCPNLQREDPEGIRVVAAF